MPNLWLSKSTVDLFSSQYHYRKHAETTYLQHSKRFPYRRIRILHFNRTSSNVLVTVTEKAWRDVFHRIEYNKTAMSIDRDYRTNTIKFSSQILAFCLQTVSRWVSLKMTYANLLSTLETCTVRCRCSLLHSTHRHVYKRLLDIVVTMVIRARKILVKTSPMSDVRLWFKVRKYDNLDCAVVVENEDSNVEFLLNFLPT